MRNVIKRLSAQSLRWVSIMEITFAEAILTVTYCAIALCILLSCIAICCYVRCRKKQKGAAKATITCTSAHALELTDDTLEARETERSPNDHLAATSFACTVQNPTYSPTDICHGLENSVDYEDVI